MTPFYDILMIRFRGKGKIYVFRLSELEWYLVELMEWNHNVDSLLHNENNDFQVKNIKLV